MAPERSSSKGGVIALVRPAALDPGPHGVRVNAVAPSTERTRAGAGEAFRPLAGEAGDGAAAPGGNDLLGGEGSADGLGGRSAAPTSWRGSRGAAKRRHGQPR